ncbi:MAG: hypothetical protein GYA55_06980 [SAR324 cluster bacterium]|uniref:Uncharacterized protein n=1 Tax=SAR324 cluster bacterium TaxID=2024889 RepID=A0A7X9FRE4_9DELT|nr:hypothetical protein [SAR324 cluster bacterium]
MPVTVIDPKATGVSRPLKRLSFDPRHRRALAEEQTASELQFYGSFEDFNEDLIERLSAQLPDGKNQEHDKSYLLFAGNLLFLLHQRSIEVKPAKLWEQYSFDKNGRNMHGHYLRTGFVTTLLDGSEIFSDLLSFEDPIFNSCSTKTPKVGLLSFDSASELCVNNEVPGVPLEKVEEIPRSIQNSLLRIRDNTSLPYVLISRQFESALKDFGLSLGPTWRPVI